MASACFLESQRRGWLQFIQENALPRGSFLRWYFAVSAASSGADKHRACGHFVREFVDATIFKTQKGNKNVLMHCYDLRYRISKKLNKLRGTWNNPDLHWFLNEDYEIADRDEYFCKTTLDESQKKSGKRMEAVSRLFAERIEIPDDGQQLKEIGAWIVRPFLLRTIVAKKAVDICRRMLEKYEKIKKTNDKNCNCIPILHPMGYYKLNSTDECPFAISEDDEGQMGQENFDLFFRNYSGPPELFPKFAVAAWLSYRLNSMDEEGRGFHAAVPTQAWEVFRKQLCVDTELFASPLNRTLEKCGSLSPEIDRYFIPEVVDSKSLGNVEPPGRCIEINPPWGEAVLEQVADAVGAWLRGPSPLTAIVLLPCWDNGATSTPFLESFSALRHEFLQLAIYMRPDSHQYEGLGQKPFYSVCPTVLYVLSNCPQSDCMRKVAPEIIKGFGAENAVAIYASEFGDWDRSRRRIDGTYPAFYNSPDPAWTVSIDGILEGAPLLQSYEEKRLLGIGEWPSSDELASIFAPIAAHTRRFENSTWKQRKLRRQR